MKEGKDEFLDKKMRMWKMRDELLNAMGEKELRAFIKGYMMAERSVFKNLRKMNQANDDCGRCNECSCKGESCGCGDKDCKECNCEKEQS